MQEAAQAAVCFGGWWLLLKLDTCRLKDAFLGLRLKRKWYPIFGNQWKKNALAAIKLTHSCRGGKIQEFIFKNIVYSGYSLCERMKTRLGFDCALRSLPTCGSGCAYVAQGLPEPACDVLRAWCRRDKPRPPGCGLICQPAWKQPSRARRALPLN